MTNIVILVGPSAQTRRSAPRWASTYPAHPKPLAEFHPATPVASIRQPRTST